jgi:hypothetical protein
LSSIEPWFLDGLGVLAEFGVKVKEAIVANRISIELWKDIKLCKIDWSAKS